MARPPSRRQPLRPHAKIAAALVQLVRRAACFVSEAPCTVRFELSGYRTEEIGIRPKLSGWYWGNFGFGGLLGMLVIDPATGSMWNLTPDKVDRTLSKEQSTLLNTGNGFVVALISDLSPEEREQMVRIRWRRLRPLQHPTAFLRQLLRLVAWRMAGQRSKISSPSFRGRRAASLLASRRASKCSAKRDTRAEVSLQAFLRSARLHFRKDAATLIGRPDIVFTRSRVAVFVDGDFWHGRQLKKRLARLSAGHNSDYWTQKILANSARDRRTTQALRRMGWKVIRAWESDIKRDVACVGAKIESAVRARTLLGASKRDQALARKRATAP